MRISFLPALILSLGVGSAYSQSICRHITAPDAPLIEIEAKGEDQLLKVTLTDPIDSKFYTEARVKHENGRNVVSLTFLLRDLDGNRSQVLRANESFRKILEIIKQNGIEIDAFMLMWNDHFRDFDGPSDELLVFMKNYRDSLARSSGSLKLPQYVDHYIPKEFEDQLVAAAEAGAWSTLSGKYMKRLGFNFIDEVQIIQTPGYLGADRSMGAIDVRVIWSKKRVTDKAVVKAITKNDSKSSLPRFHMFIQNMSKYFDRKDR